MRGVARAHPNIALVKYWGKRDLEGNLPAVSSLSLTVAGLETVTAVEFRPDLPRDEVWLDGRPATQSEGERVARVLDRVREMAGITAAARVESASSFPVASGLASSASGFAALTVAAVQAAGLRLDLGDLARIARRGSGSAPRSLLGGFVALPAGSDPEGADSVPEALLPPGAWDLRVVIVRTTTETKETGSTEGMIRTQRTSPFYPTWLARNARDFSEAVRAVRERDLFSLGAIAEANALAMHATALTADPPLFYWNGATVEVMRRVRELRQQGLRAFFTVDAGAHVVVLSTPEEVAQVAREVSRLPGVLGTEVHASGGGAEVLV